MVTSGIQWVKLGVILFSRYMKHATPANPVIFVFLSSS